MTTHDLIGESVIKPHYTSEELRAWIGFLEELIEDIREECWRNSLTIRKNLYVQGFDLEALLRRNDLLISVIYQLGALKYPNLTRMIPRTEKDLRFDYSVVEKVSWPERP